MSILFLNLSQLFTTAIPCTLSCKTSLMFTDAIALIHKANTVSKATDRLPKMRSVLLAISCITLEAKKE